MPTVKRPAALVKAYNATKKKIEERDIPTIPILQGHVLYRSINPTSPYTSLPMPAPGGHVSKAQANKLLVPADHSRDLSNRFSGPGAAGIGGAGALYFVLQQQALVNESTHYSGKSAYWALAGRCVLKIRTMGSILVADISPHNPAGRRFLKELGPKAWDEMTDPDDCSVARGIGLAIAHSGFLAGLAAQTVRESERSDDERGDNLILFAAPGQAIPQLYIEQAAYYGKRSEPEIFPVAFP